MIFDKNEDGSYLLKSGGGLSYPRVLSCGDSTGNRLMGPILKRVKDLGIPIFENTQVDSLQLNKNGTPVLNINENGLEKQLNCRNLIIATGGLLPPEKRAGLDSNHSPDGVELARMVGAETCNPDLIQYHPTGIVSPKSLRRERLPEKLRSLGARIVDKNYQEIAPGLLTRGELTKSIVDACKEGRGVSTSDGYVGVWLTTSDIEPKYGSGYIKANYPKFYNMFIKEGINMSVSDVLVYPIVHYSLGGIRINHECQTSIPRIYAVGETTYGIHGEDRLMGNSLLDIFVFGKVAGESVGRAVKKVINE